jgi:hypothetical protein
VFDKLNRPTSRVITGALTKNWGDAEQAFDHLDGALKKDTFKGRTFKAFRPGTLPDGAWKSIMVKLAWESHDSAYELLHEIASGNFAEFLDGQHNNEIVDVLQRWDPSAYYNVIRNIDMRDNEAKVNGFSGQTFEWFPTQAEATAKYAAISATIPAVHPFHTLHGATLLHSLGILYGILRYLKEKIAWPARTKKKRPSFVQAAYDRLDDVQQLLRERAQSAVDVPDNQIGDLPEMPIAILFLLVAFFVFALTQ